MEVFGGTAGWSYEDWVGPFYPERPPRGFSRLRFYSNFLDCVEVDSTFYRHFPPTVAEKWLTEVEGNPRFVFLTKLYKSFTHGDRDGGDLSKDREVILEFVRPFLEQRKLGGMLVQFSEYFRDNSRSREKIQTIAGQFQDLRLFFELRHTSWYSDAAGKFLQDNGIGIIAIDQPRLKGMVELTPEIVGEIGYFRLHGRNEKMWESSRKDLMEGESRSEKLDRNDPGRNDRYDYLYGDEELDEIEGKIRKVAERCNRIYVVTNNHPMGKAVANALELVKRLRNQERVKIPDTVIKYFPELERIAEKVEANPSDTLF